MLYIREEIIPNPPFQSSGSLLVILSVSRNIYFGDTGEVSLIGPKCMCYDNMNECVLKSMSGDVMNPIFHIILMIFVKGLPMDFCDGLESITTV